MIGLGCGAVVWGEDLDTGDNDPLEPDEEAKVKVSEKPKVSNGQRCSVVRGTHAGKYGEVQDIKTSKTGHITITVVQENGERFKTLARNVLVSRGRNS